MADRYWVGGTAAWDGTAGTKWALTSGGPGGEAVPTSADDVFFSSASTGTCTISTGNTGAKSINCTGFTGTLTGTAAITVSGSITLVAGMTYTYTGTLTIAGTGTLTSGGKTLGALTINGSGITVTLGSALTLGTSTLTLTQGTLDTSASNYSLTYGNLSSTNSNTRGLTLNGSTVNASGSSPFGTSLTGTFTLNAGTSQINFTNASAIVSNTGLTFYNVSFTSTTAGTRQFIGISVSTFNNLTLSPPSASGMVQLAISGGFTVNGTFTCAGATALRRCFLYQGNTAAGTPVTITVATLSANDCDFRDITLAGAASGSAPTRAGDCGGNSNITFPAAKNVYRVGTDTTWGGSSSWALSSGAGGSDNNFPLAQDTVFFDNSSTAATTTIGSPFNIGIFNTSSRTNALTFNFSGASNFHGSFTIGSGLTIGGTATQTFAGRSTMTFTTAGKTITFPITVNAPSGTFLLADALTTSNSITFTNGTIDAAIYNVSITNFASSATSPARTLTMGSGTWTLSGATAWNVAVSGITVNKGTANIVVTAGSPSFTGGGYSYNKLTMGGTTLNGVLTISSAGTTFTEIASTRTVAHVIRFASDIGLVNTWSAKGTSGNVITVDSDVAGTRRLFGLANVTSGIDYLSVKDIGVNDSNKFYAGTNSTDGGNNVNVYFTATPANPPSGGIMLMMFN